MTRRSFVLAVGCSLLFLRLLAGCGGGDSNPEPDPDVATDVGAGADVLPDAAPDASAPDVAADVGVPDAGADVPEDVGAVDGEADADPGADVDACVCDVEDACCDGCQPINDAGVCGDDDPCVSAGACDAGACVGGGEPVVCTPAGPCQVGEGACDPATGTCVFDEPPVGTPCEAVEGIDGSGLCRSGECRGFGDCDHRSYDQPFGWPCNFDGECESGWCMAWGDDWARYCTRACGEDRDACPEGSFCVNGGVNGGGDAGRFCRPLDRDGTLPGDGSQPLYAVCNDDADCAGGLCLAFDDLRFCTQDCESATTPGTADAGACGTCGRCRDNGDELGFDFAFYCVPQGDGQLGDPCGWGGDCRRRFCQSGLCSDQCIEFEGISNCPDDMACVPGLLADPVLRVCVPKDEVGRALGDSCVGDHSCAEGQECREILGDTVCTMDCTPPPDGEDGEPTCAEGLCLEVASRETACLPEAWVGTVSYGARCQADFQCADEAVCYRGACLTGCDSPDDCGERACTPDVWYQAAYCAPTCVSEADCPERLSCVDGACLLNADGAVYVNSTCRSDADCRTGLCAGGICSDTCSETVPCEGSVALPIPEYGLCKPCDPNNFGMECDEDWGLSDCVRGLDGAYFCATECFIRGEGVCPVGTRCYGTGGYSAVCAPISGSCTMQAAACTSRGVCSQPLPETSPCEEDADCGFGPCVLGRCAGPECAADADCGCALLVCADDRCAVDGAAGLADAEPNDTLADAQVLGGEPQRILGTLIALDGAPDSDLYRVPLAAGQVLDVWTSPFCGQYADTRLRFFADDGTPLADWAFDSISPDYPFSILDRYVAAEAHDVVIEVTQGAMVVGNARSNYVLDVNVFTPAANDTCEGATPIAADGTPATFDLALSNRDMDAPSCTGAVAMGKDMAFSVTVPAGSVLNAFAETPFDSQLYLVSDCAAIDATCVAGADVVWEPGPEALVYANEGDVDQDLVLVVDSFLPESDMVFDLTVTLAPIVAAANDDAASAERFQYGTTTVDGSTVGATDTYDGGDEGCVGVALPGRDVVYVADLDPGAFLTVTTDAYAGVNPVLLLTSDPADPEGCLDVAQGMVQVRNTGVALETVYLVVDGLPADGYAVFTLTAYMGRSDECFGPCDPQSTAWACVDGAATDLCLCDGATRTLTAFDCDAYCIDDGALSGTCYAFTAPGHERDSCRCDYDCAPANDHCERQIYTNCTCGAADPCDWQDNGGCDEFCAIEYPTDFFDDTADCTAE